MKKLTHLMVIFLCINYAALAKITEIKTTVFFNTDEHQLTAESVNNLSSFISNNLNNKDYEIKIEGHTDNIGDIAYNKQLSHNRAKEVKQFLVALGVKSKQIEVDFKGELDPDKPNINDNYRGKNRRVEVTLITYRFDNIEELEHALNPNKKSIHIIDPTQQNLIKGNKGVKILIEPNTFVYEDGSSVIEKVKFELTESLAFKDFVSSGLLTQTADDVLETGGMIKLEAITVSGKKVSVKKNNPMMVSIPNDNFKDNMEVFVSDVGKEWSANNQPIQRISREAVFSRGYEMEDYPIFRNNNSVKLPKFKADKSGKPEKPELPYLSREPKEPRAESYLRPIPWYRFNKTKIRERQQKYYDHAMNQYFKRLEKYDAKLNNYQCAMDNYQKEKEEYLCKLEYWEADIEYQRQQFKQSPDYQRLFKKHQAIYAANLKIYKEKVAAWRKKRAEKMTALGQKMDKLGIADEKTLNNYVFAFNQLKWINVDRFYHLKEEQKQLITMKGDKVGDERVLILFKNIESMLPMNLNKVTEDYRQYNFPKGEEAVIFAYKVENGKPYLCYREIDGSEDYQLDYQETSFFEIKTILSQFDGPKNS